MNDRDWIRTAWGALIGVTVGALAGAAVGAAGVYLLRSPACVSTAHAAAYMRLLLFDAAAHMMPWAHPTRPAIGYMARVLRATPRHMGC